MRDGLLQEAGVGETAYTPTVFQSRHATCEKAHQFTSPAGTSKGLYVWVVALTCDAFDSRGRFMCWGGGGGAPALNIDFPGRQPGASSGPGLARGKLLGLYARSVKQDESRSFGRRLVVLRLPAGRGGSCLRCFHSSILGRENVKAMRSSVPIPFFRTAMPAIEQRELIAAHRSEKIPSATSRGGFAERINRRGFVELARSAACSK